MITAEMSLTGRLSTPEAVIKYMFAGNATFTLRSVKTGTRFTYKVRRAEEVTDVVLNRTPPPTWFVSVLTGDNNENDFSYMGVFGANKVFRFTAKSRVTAEAPSAKAFVWFVHSVIHNGQMNPALEIWHEGRCGRCGRKLTVPESVAAGIGPDCEGRM